MASHSYLDRSPTPRASSNSNTSYIAEHNQQRVKSKPVASNESFRTPLIILDSSDDSEDSTEEEFEDKDEEPCHLGDTMPTNRSISNSGRNNEEVSKESVKEKNKTESIESLNDSMKKMNHSGTSLNQVSTSPVTDTRELFAKRSKLRTDLESANKKKTELNKSLKYSKNLPDGGAKIRSKLAQCEEEIIKLTTEVANIQVSIDTKGGEELGGEKYQVKSGKKCHKKIEEERSVTVEAMKKIHESLETIPSEGDEEEEPINLKPGIRIYPHQKQGLSWLLWRETQDPSGGILADDMGLGKTLMMISLILKSRDLDYSVGEDDVMHLVKSNSTLIICPASLIGQWEREVRSKVKKNVLNMYIYHGNKRKCSAKALAKHDIVLTTYGTLQSEVKSQLDKQVKESGESDPKSSKSELLDILWERIILDEAHQIRNPSSKTSQSVCLLRASKRWCVTGTPIQNKELDLYSLLRFLRCHPFDEYQVWKRWIEDNSDQGQGRMNTLVKTLMLRRTKDQKSLKTGKKLVELPEKNTKQHIVTLSKEENEVYERVFGFSQSAIKNYMAKAREGGKDKQGTMRKTKEEKKAHVTQPIPFQSGEVKAHHLLVLLLRLRQICCHPSLIKSMLDQNTKADEGIEEDGEEIDLISAMEDMNISRMKGGNDLPEKILNIQNPIFDEARPSSKIEIVTKELRKILKKNKEGDDIEKSVIVSQWTSLLNIMKLHLEQMGIDYAEINGQVDVKQRGGIVEDFNTNQHGPCVMLLSLAAGGVGLNLVGANHLFLMDMHWNPQLEAQACDRIYRVGQTRRVTIHR